MADRIAKLTISIPSELLAITDEIAAEQRISRSRLVYHCLRDLADKRLKQRMAAGYKALAKDNSRFASQTINIAHEILPDQE